MIVEDKKITLEHANTISNHLTSLLNKEIKKIIQNDPAEHIYLLGHIASNFLARICIVLENYGKEGNNISQLTMEKILEWINKTTDEYIKANKTE